jgi:copper transport protein
MRNAIRVLALLLTLAAWVAFAPSAAAHASVVASYPRDGSVMAAPPTTIHFWFSEPVQPVGPGIIVISPSGGRVPIGPLHADGLEMWAAVQVSAPGTYLVIWQVISLDTHPERGRITFSLGQESAVPGSPGFGPVSTLGLALQVLGRWLHLIGFALAFGPVAFRLLVLAPLGLGGTLSRRVLWRISGMGIVLLLAAEPVALLGQTASLSNGLWDTDLAGEALSSSFGRVLAQRLGAAAALWMLVGVVRAGAARAEWLMLALGVALAFADGQASHAVSSGPLFVGLLASAGHELAMVLWAGGLVSLLVVWNLADVAPCRGQVFRAFGEIAVLCLLALGVTGLVMALLHLRAPRDLLDADYGRALTLKTVLLGAALALTWQGSRPRRAARETIWRVELLAMGGILALASAMVSLAPPA